MSLSEKEFYGNGKAYIGAFSREDVKEFIRRLKEDYKFKIKTIKGKKYIKVEDYVRFIDFLDKCAGENLMDANCTKEAIK